jgi:COX Aromatic Rich Motif.
MQDKNNPLTLQGYKKLYDPDMDMPAQYYSQVPKGLFMKIMMQYMESKNWLHEKV